jgi:hypothetical protein
MRPFLIAFGLLLVIFAFLFRPVCVPLTDEELASFDVPIERRTDRDIYFKVFQKWNGRWYRCQTWISRALFF